MQVAFTYPPPGWEVPGDRFVEYDPRDMVWARGLGLGKATVCQVTETFPRCVVTSMRATPQGMEMEFRALPTGPESSLQFRCPVVECERI
jgi:hypothetical protein